MQTRFSLISTAGGGVRNSLRVVMGGALALGLMCAVSGPVHAQATPTKPTAPTKPGAPAVNPVPPAPAQSGGPINDPDYVIGINDVIAVSAVGNEEIADVEPVLPDGTITIKGIPGIIHAEGMTLKKLTDVVFTGLNKLYNNLNLSVSVKESHSKFVTIIGARSSGQYTLTPDMRVSQLIALAGGSPIIKTKYLDGVLIRNYKTTKLDMLKILGSNNEGLNLDPKADPVLQNHDEIVLDTRDEAPPPSFEVIGAVTKPGEYSLPLNGSPFTLAQAVAIAAGQVQDADLGKVVLIRDQQKINLNLRPFLIEGKADASEAHLEIKAGDVLLFPQALAKYMVLGLVNRPASFPLPENEKISVLRALADAGGPAPNSELRKAGLMRIADGKTTYVPLDLDRAIRLAKKYPKQVEKMNAILMQDGDVLYIPEKGKPFNISDYVSPLFLFSSLGLHPF